MNIDEFRAELESEIQNASFDSGQSFAAAFAEKITDMMREAEYLNGDFQESFFTGTPPKRRSNLRVDGWLQDAADNSLVLFIVHYDDGNENMIKTLAEKNFKMLEDFVDAVLTSDLELEESTSTAELADILRKSTDEKFKFILLTNARPTIKRNDIKNFFVRGNEVDCQIWDIERIFAVYSSLQVREPVTINFADGLPCLRATNADNCESFLCVIPGKTTILNKPEMFFAFNNGIAATAKQIELQECGGLFIAAVNRRHANRCAGKINRQNKFLGVSSRRRNVICNIKHVGFNTCRSKSN